LKVLVVVAFSATIPPIGGCMVLVIISYKIEYGRHILGLEKEN
jgi:hypothetical protein